MKKRILTLLITFSLLLSCCVIVSSEEDTLPFTDVKAGKWYYDAVVTVYNEGIMEGMREGIFAPSEDMTRAQLVTILARLASADTSGCAAGLTFKDTKKSAWYADAVGWAVSAGLVTGYLDNTFKPNDKVLRQELAVLFARFLTANYITLPEIDNPATFADAGKIPKWAAEGVDVMRLCGIVTGDNNGNFNPQKSASRAEIAVMITRYLAAKENTVDPMFAKFDNINSLVKKEMGKILLTYYNYQRVCDYGFENSISDQLLPQMGLSTDVYEMVSSKADLNEINESTVNSVMFGFDDSTEPIFFKSAPVFIRNKLTGEVTETKNLGFTVKRLKSPEIDPDDFDKFMDRDIYDEMISKSLAKTGNIARFAKVFEKAAKGEPITVGFIGGSITQGAISGAQRQNCWARVTTQWIQKQFPNTDVTYVNAGIGGTGSDYGNFRAETHLFSYEPDIVFIEFSVNDNPDNTLQHETYEALVRRSLNLENSPAVALVISVLASDKAVSNAMEYAEYYGLPVVNANTGVYYAIDAGEFSFQEYAPDGTHPYEWGHRVMADMVINMIKNIVSLAETATQDELTIQPVPDSPITECNYDNLLYTDAEELAKGENTWELVDVTEGDYKGRKALVGEAGDTLKFTLNAKNAVLLIKGSDISVSINGSPALIEKYSNFTIIRKGDSAAELNIEITATGEITLYGVSYN